MAEPDTLQKLIDDGSIATSLRKGSSARQAITALQNLLHWLGFDRKLKWEKFGADGDYGRATTAAVADFAKRNGSTANGERVSKALAAKILARYDSLEALKQLAGDVEKKKIETKYRKGGGDRIRIAALQTLLHDLGFGRQLNWKRYGADGDYGGSTTSAVAAFGKREGIGGDGTVLTLPLARRVVKRLGALYGGSWNAPSRTPTPAPGSPGEKSVTGNKKRRYLEVSGGVISLGCCDADVSGSACDAYLQQIEEITRVRLAAVKGGSDKLTFKKNAPDKQPPMTVKQVQQELRTIGFFPGGQLDGICGYRTLSAIRLFQEYVRTIEKRRSCIPDGIFGAGSCRHLKRWSDSGRKPEWAPTIEGWRAGTLGQTEYARWLALLGRVKEKYTASPNRMLQLVNAFSGATDTKKVAQWDFDPRHVHLIGIRRGEFSGKFDDVIVLLIKGLVFKFQGSTEPGQSSNKKGAPFLVQGQHDYHFGWHQRKYLALRPQRLDKGVLVVRSKGDMRLDERDLDSGLEANPTINIHWGGKGEKRSVNKWSEGCQVINGTLYINHDNELMDCSRFAAINNKEVAKKPSKTRAAYNVLLDLVTALSGDMGSSTVKYMLLAEQDLDLDRQLKRGLGDARAKVRKQIGHADTAGP